MSHPQSVLRAFVLAASDVNTLRYVENDNIPDARVLSSTNQQFMHILDNYDLCTQTNTLGFFAPKPTDFMVKCKAEKDQQNNALEPDCLTADPQLPITNKKGWLIASRDLMFPELKHSKRPCLFFYLGRREALNAPTIIGRILVYSNDKTKLQSASG